MILVNISAVATSTTLTLIPVSFSHIGPEKLRGSSDCSPASHTIVMVEPEYFLASLTARSAAESAQAEAAQPTASAAAAAIIGSFCRKRILSLPVLQPLTASPGGAFDAGVQCALVRILSFASPRSPAELRGVSGKPLAPCGRRQQRLVDDPAGVAAVHDVEHRLHVRCTDAGKALIGPAQRMRREDHVVELQ